MDIHLQFTRFLLHLAGRLVELAVRTAQFLALLSIGRVAVDVRTVTVRGHFQRDTRQLHIVLFDWLPRLAGRPQLTA